MTRTVSPPLSLILALGLLAPTVSLVAQPPDPVFDDTFVTGDTSRWSESVPTFQPHCNCYFSGDCPSGMFCYWGPGGPFNEDNCNWRLPKPSGVGTGCTADAFEPGPICDGFCTPSLHGSLFGREDREVVAQAVRLWSDALLVPALSGGGAVDPGLAAQARNLPFRYPATADLLGRQVADALALVVGGQIQEQYCHFEHHPNEEPPVVDLSGDHCQRAAAQRMADAVVDELLLPGAGSVHLATLPDDCPELISSGLGDFCQGPETLACIQDRVEELVQFLTTPRQHLPAEP